MAALPQLTPEAQRVLRALLGQNNLGGGDLMRRTGLTAPGQLSAALKQLQQTDLVQVSGDTSNENELAFATIGIRPSSAQYLKERAGGPWNSAYRPTWTLGFATPL
jgi:hypothetical protein